MRIRILVWESTCKFARFFLLQIIEKMSGSFASFLFQMVQIYSSNSINARLTTEKKSFCRVLGENHGVLGKNHGVLGDNHGVPRNPVQYIHN